MASPLKPSLNWLLVFVPIAAYLEYGTSDKHLWIFLCSCMAIIPLAGLMGEATEHLAEKTGAGIGGLLNATFGNAAELIIALMALRAGQYEIVKASLTGSIIGNILLVLGASFVAGGMKFKQQKFNGTAARSQATMLTLAAIALIAPMGYHYLAGPSTEAIRRERDLSLEISVVLLITYALSLLFSLHTHKQLFSGEKTADAFSSYPPLPHLVSDPSGAASASSAGHHMATALVAWVSEFLVGSVGHAAHDLGMSNIFVGVIVVAVIGNAAEHSTALIMAMKDRMDLAYSIAIGSSLQIALFVAPVLVLASYWLGPLGPMDLVFTPAEVLAITLAILITEQIASDGESNWLEGVQLLSVYLIIALVFYYLPDAKH
jgi:Ca2+:H+ antiporter